MADNISKTINWLLLRNQHGTSSTEASFQAEFIGITEEFDRETDKNINQKRFLHTEEEEAWQYSYSSTPSPRNEHS
jgi:hypothetical protein